MSLAISLADAQSICATVWPDEAQARRQIGYLGAAGYEIRWHQPPRISIHHRGLRLARIMNPRTGGYVGDVSFMPAVADA